MLDWTSFYTLAFWQYGKWPRLYYPMGIKIILYCPYLYENVYLLRTEITKYNFLTLKLLV